MQNYWKTTRSLDFSSELKKNKKREQKKLGKRKNARKKNLEKKIFNFVEPFSFTIKPFKRREKPKTENQRKTFNKLKIML